MIDIDTVIANLAGVPAITVPAGFSNDLPIGLQIMASEFQEQKLFTALLFESNTNIDRVQNCDGIDEARGQRISWHKNRSRNSLSVDCLHSKLFCSCFCNYHGLEPNGNICPICCGLPGTLPLQIKAVESTAWFHLP